MKTEMKAICLTALIACIAGSWAITDSFWKHNAWASDVTRSLKQQRVYLERRDNRNDIRWLDDQLAKCDLIKLKDARMQRACEQWLKEWEDAMLERKALIKNESRTLK